MAARTYSTRHSARTNEYAIVITGVDGAEHHVLRSQLTKHSRSFINAFEESEQVDDNYRYQLEDVDSDTLEIFTNWLQTKMLPELLGHWDQPEQHASTELRLTKTYVFAHRYDFPQLKAAVLQEFHNSYLAIGADGAPIGGVPLYQTIITGFAGLPADDVLLKLCVDLYCYYFDAGLDSDGEIQQRVNLPHEFLLRVMVRHSQILNCDCKGGLDKKDCQLDITEDEAVGGEMEIAEAGHS